jgi:hypothetical protein
LGKKAVRELKPSDVRQFFLDVKAGKTAADVKTGKRGRAIVKGGEFAAKRCVGLLQGILRHAVDMGLIETNPAHGIRLPKDNERKITDLADKLAALGRALELARSGELQCASTPPSAGRSTIRLATDLSREEATTSIMVQGERQAAAHEPAGRRDVAVIFSGACPLVAGGRHGLDGLR